VQLDSGKDLSCINLSPVPKDRRVAAHQVDVDKSLDGIPKTALHFDAILIRSLEQIINTPHHKKACEYERS